MINQLEVPMYLENALPDIFKDLKTDKKENAYKNIDALTVFMCRNIKDHDYTSVKKCFQVADKLYTKGNDVVKNAVENIFVYSFTNMFQSYPAEKRELLAIIPGTLYSLYVAQIYHSGC